MISAWDSYCAIKLRDELLQGELNPIGQWLMYLDGGDVSLFMGVKFAGTILVLGILAFLYMHRKKLAWALIIPLILFQAFLLAFLEGWI